MKNEPTFPLDELAIRHSALQMARIAEDAIRAGVPVTRVTSAMIIEQARQGKGPKLSADARYRASRNGGLTRARMLADQRRAKEGCGL